MAKLHVILIWGANEAYVESLNKTHFIVNIDYDKTLGIRGDENVEYVGVASVDVGMTMVDHIRGG